MSEEISVNAPVLLRDRLGVELVAAGTWEAGTGRATFTRDDLAEAVAALDCPGIRNPVLKLGHQEEDSTSGVRWDGEPAVGWVANMRLDADGVKIVGDFRGMPAWLDDVLPSAYPDRSVEIMRPMLCQIGHRHPAVITAVALLGVVPPAVGVIRSLQDVRALYTTSAPPAPGPVRMSVSVGGELCDATVHGGPPVAEVPIRISPSRPGRFVRLAFDPSQPRDADGKWGSGGWSKKSGSGMTDDELIKAKPWKEDRGPGAPGVIYSDEAELNAYRLLDSYARAEPDVTTALSEVASDAGGHMEGLKNRLKGQESLARKIEQKSASKGLTMKQYTEKIGDALRYTMIVPPDRYGESAQQAIERFRSEGYDVEVENTWRPGASYKGINTNMKREGLIFEVQFHTPASFGLKSAAHELYELARDTSRSPEERAAATQKMIDNATALPTPNGAGDVS